MVDYLKVGQVPNFQLVRKNPAAERLGTKQKQTLERYASEYTRFLQKSRIAAETVDNVQAMALEKGYKTDFSEEPFFIKSQDGNAFALVNPGRAGFNMKDWVRIIFSHTDSPRLRIKPSPTLFNWDPEDVTLTTGVRLDAYSMGGFEPKNWQDTQVDIVGYIEKEGRRRKIELEGFIPEKSAHVVVEEEEPTIERLDVEVFIQSVKALYKELRISGERDFGRIKLDVVPKFQVNRPNAKDYLIGYGHDDRSSVYASSIALLESRPSVPCFVFGLDQEETGSQGIRGAYHGFVRYVLNTTFKDILGVNDNIIDLFSQRQEQKLSIPAICADVDIAPTYHDLGEEYASEIDKGNIAKFGYGPSLNVLDSAWSGNVVDLSHADYLIALFEESLGKSRFQVTGSYIKADYMGDTGTQAEVFTREGIATVNFGIPSGSLHRLNEILHVADMFWAINGYKAYLTKTPSFWR